MTTGERLSQIIDHLKTSNNGFATSIGVSSTVINGIVANKNNPGHKILTGIKNVYPQINIEWLLNGKGEMFTQERESLNPISRDYLQEYLEKLEAQFERLLSQLETKDKQIEKLLDILGKLSPAPSNARVFERDNVVPLAA